MAYTKQKWTTKTPITPEALNHIEDGISNVDNNSAKMQDIKIDYIDNQEVPTNEYLNGKRIYAKRFSTTEEINNSKITIKMNLPAYTNAWIDVSNSYFRNVMNRILPITANFYVDWNTNITDQISASIEQDNLYIIGNGGWGDAWEKVVTVKYTKKTE